MPACAMRQLCLNGDMSGDFCVEFSLLADICHNGMNMQGLCNNYNSLCATGSVVQECQDYAPVQNYLTYADVQTDVNSLCGSMPNMDACQQCTQSSNGWSCSSPLVTVSSICQSMWMNGCSNWQSMCQALENDGSGNYKALCGSGGAGAPEMLMYFHTGFNDYVLFKGWVPRSEVYYAMTWLFVLGVGIINQFGKIWRSSLEGRWGDDIRKRTMRGPAVLASNMEGARGYSSASSLGRPPAKGQRRADGTWEIKPANKTTRSPSDESALLGVNVKADCTMCGYKIFCGRNSARACTTTMIVGIDYLLMLIAMTFNVGLFIAVILGYGLGMFLTGVYRDNKNIRKGLKNRASMSVGQQPLMDDDDESSDEAYGAPCCGV